MASDSTIPFEIFVPDFAKLSEEELAQRLIFFDGPWHPQTKAAVRRFKADGLELNLNWANEAYLWSCPVCKRRKADIFRLPKAGNLKATLEWHHDHLGDFFKKELVRLFGHEWKLGVTDEHRHLERIASSLVARFHPTLICSDCNEIDSRLKQMISVDNEFSFSPLETARCITASPHSTHGLEKAVAEEIWQDRKADFEDRKALVTLLIEKLKGGGLKKERSFGSPFFRNGMDFYRLMVEVVPAPASTFIYNTLADLRFRSVSRPIRTDNPTRARARRIVVPTDADLETIVGNGVATRKWKAVSDVWRCPVCDRSKREVVRKSKAKEWFAAVFTQVECCIRPGFNNGDVEISGRVDHHHTFFICGDCHAVMPELRRRTSDTDIYGSHLTADQLRQVVTATAHAPHEIDWEKAAFFAAENAKWNAAIEDYWPDFRHAVFVKETFDRLLERLGMPHDDTVVALAERTRPDYPADWSLGEVANHLDFVLERAVEWEEHASSSFSHDVAP